MRAASDHGRNLKLRRRCTELVLASLLTTSATACAIQRGKAWDQPAATPSAPAISLLLIGEAGPATWRTTKVARQLARTLAERRAAGIPTVLLWLGNNLQEPCAPQTASTTPHLAELVRVGHDHRARGGHSFAVLGSNEWRCGPPSVHIQTSAGHRPWLQPAANYVVRIDDRGHARVVSRCTPTGCTVEPASADAWLDLVFVDTAAWLDNPPADRPLAAVADAVVAEQAALLASLAAQPQPGVPRLLVTHHPVETAGPHGQGGLFPDSAFALHPAPLRQAIDTGMFAGVVSGRDRTLSATSDIFSAVKRSSRHWLQQPVFQVVSGGTSKPDVAGGRRGFVYYQGQSLAPDILSNRTGFAEVLVTPDHYTARVQQRKLGRWQAAELHIERDRPPHPAETQSPVMDPCLRCNPLPAPQ